jgi:hypothetical protein
VKAVQPTIASSPLRLYRVHAQPVPVPVAPVPELAKTETHWSAGRDDSRAPAVGRGRPVGGRADESEQQRGASGRGSTAWRETTPSIPAAVLYSLLDQMGGSPTSVWRGMHVDLVV